MDAPIPLELLLSGRDLTEPRLAPIGPPQVAFVQRNGGVSSINAVWLDRPAVERTLTFGPAPAPGRGLGGGCFTWVAQGGELSIVYVARDGGLWWQRGTALTHLGGGASSDGEAGPTCRAPSVDAEGATVAYVRDEAEVWALDLRTAASAAPRRLDDGRHEFCFDPCVSPDGRTVSWQGWSPPHMPWDASVRVDVDVATGAISTFGADDAAIQQPRFTVSGEPIHIDDRSGWLNVSIVDGPVVAEPCDHAGPTWGMGNRSFAVGPGGRRVAVCRNVGGFGELTVVDRQRNTERVLGRGVHGHIDWVGDAIAAVRTGARTPTSIVVYDPVSGDRRTLATSGVDAWPLDDLPEPELIEAPAGDGATLFARRFVAGEGRQLVWVHGGPTDQWQVDWRPRITYWWSRGWDVLVVDPRGTTGHGREYQQALHGGWGRLDVDDTAALIEHAHAAGWATPDSTVVIGGSSGGLTVLGVLADRPDLVAGGVASYPVSDLRALTEVTHRFEAHYTDTLVAPNDGSPESDARFQALSPVHRADQISKPLLVFHGTDDPVVPVEQSRALFEQLVSSGVDGAELVEFEGEGHGFRDAVNVRAEYERTERFLSGIVGSWPS